MNNYVSDSSRDPSSHRCQEDRLRLSTARLPPPPLGCRSAPRPPEGAEQGEFPARRALCEAPHGAGPADGRLSAGSGRPAGGTRLRG